jgi:hypothetical protein
MGEDYVKAAREINEMAGMEGFMICRSNDRGLWTRNQLFAPTTRFVHLTAFSGSDKASPGML